MAMKRISSDRNNEPIAFYYQFKEPDKAHPKVRVLKKGDRFTGTYLHTFKDEEYQTHLFQTNEQGKITIKGCTGLNKDLATLSRNTPVEIVYLGLGKKKPGRRAPYLFDLSADVEATPPARTATEDTEELDEKEPETEEEFDEEVPF